MKPKLLFTAALGIALSAPAWAQDTWPQPETAYSSTQPRAQWLTPPQTPAQQQPAQPQAGYGPQAPAYGYGYRPMPQPQGYGAPQSSYGYYGYAYPPYPPRHSNTPWQRWQPNQWPRWDNFSMPSPSVRLPSFSFPTGPFGW